jgi:hypothetical protein
MATTRNTPVLIGTTISTSIKSRYIKEVTKVAEAAGLTWDEILNEEVGRWLRVYGPIYMARAKRDARPKLFLVKKA